jgi:putative transposase
MPRANRVYSAGNIWHITQRCHRGEYLLQYSKDRRLWVRWLFEAQKRYAVSILDYVASSNPVHLLACDASRQESIPLMMQMVAGRVAQAYNRNIKKRK